MTIDQNSLANANAARALNKQFVPTANVVPRKIIAIGTFDPAKITVVPDKRVRILSAEEAGDQFGLGSVLHRMFLDLEKGSKGIEAWVTPQDEAIGAVAADGTITFDVTGVKAGTVRLYIDADEVFFNVAEGDTSDDIATKCVAAINALPNLPVTSAVDGVITDQVNIDAKMQDDYYGNNISIKFNLEIGQTLPVGMSQITVAMSGGVGTPDIQPALDDLGTGDSANADFFTDGVHAYGLDATTLNAISLYVGEGNAFTGLYDPLIARGMRFKTGDVTPGSAGLTALIVISDTRLQDRANGVIAAPGSPNNPVAIACQTIGHIARVNNNRAEESYTGIVLEGVFPGSDADRWTKNYTTGRDLAVKSGISPTKLEDGALVLQNVVSFYRPSNVPVKSNGYRSMRNISITQNILANVKSNFAQDVWKGITIVNDVALVSNFESRQKARDVESVKDDLVALIESFAGNAWIFDSSFSINELKKPGAVVIRGGGIGFNGLIKTVYSGEGGIFDNTVEFDTALTAILGNF